LESLERLLAEVPTVHVVVAPAEGTFRAEAMNDLAGALEGTGCMLASGNILHTASTGDRRAPELAASHASDGMADLRENTELLADLNLASQDFRVELLREDVGLCM